MLSTNQNVVVAAQQASEQWRSAFNSGNAARCAAQYEFNAIMQAQSFGTFAGTTEIQTFWQRLIDDGFADVEYIDSQIQVVDANQAILTARWHMNKAHGVVHQELWVLQDDGTAKLRTDHFEVMG